MTQLLTILQNNLKPLGISQSVIEKIVSEANTGFVKLREFNLYYIGEDGSEKCVPVQAANDVDAWKSFRADHPGYEPTKILDTE